MNIRVGSLIVGSLVIGLFFLWLSFTTRSEGWMVLTVVFLGLFIAVSIGNIIENKETFGRARLWISRKIFYREPKNNLEQHEPRQVGWMVYWGDKKWKLHQVDKGKEIRHGGYINQGYFDSSEFVNAWFEGRLYDQKKYATIDCNERNRKIAEDLLKDMLIE